MSGHCLDDDCGRCSSLDALLKASLQDTEAGLDRSRRSTGVYQPPVLVELPLEETPRELDRDGETLDDVQSFCDALVTLAEAGPPQSPNANQQCLSASDLQHAGPLEDDKHCQSETSRLTPQRQTSQVAANPLKEKTYGARQKHRKQERKEQLEMLERLQVEIQAEILSMRLHAAEWTAKDVPPQRRGAFSDSKDRPARPPLLPSPQHSPVLLAREVSSPAMLVSPQIQHLSMRPPMLRTPSSSPRRSPRAVPRGSPRVAHRVTACSHVSPRVVHRTVSCPQSFSSQRPALHVCQQEKPSRSISPQPQVVRLQTEETQSNYHAQVVARQDLANMQLGQQTMQPQVVSLQRHASPMLVQRQSPSMTPQRHGSPMPAKHANIESACQNKGDNSLPFAWQVATPQRFDSQRVLPVRQTTQIDAHVPPRRNVGLTPQRPTRSPVVLGI